MTHVSALAVFFPGLRFLVALQPNVNDAGSRNNGGWIYESEEQRSKKKQHTYGR